MTDPDGHEFEGNVRELFRLSGYHVEPEYQLGHKRVDTYAEERRLNATRRLAIECKDYVTRLTQEQVTLVFANYLPLWESNLIDEVVLVTRNGITPSAETLVAAKRGFVHLTLLELQNSVIDFSAHLTAMERQVHDDGLANYYVRPLLRDGSDLEEMVLDWITHGTKPLALLGSYGMGKTSFARNLSSKLATVATKDVAARIPVMVRLSDISTEQSLEGLLGKLLTTTGHVRNYTFDAFMALNRRGRFVVFLDGFDEMKHALTWEQFRFNFKELNRLVDGAARVVLLGRPSAFLSDAEYQYVLHGMRRTVAGTSRDLDWPDYEEVELQPFTPEQIREFLVGYGRHLVKRGRIEAAKADSEYLLQQINRVPKGRLTDVASRPVQLRILTEVLPQWSGDATDLTPVRLYSAFIDIVIDREQEKLTRRRFDATQRRAFARELAYWLWTWKASTFVDGARIPDYLFPSPAEGETIDGVKRDMLTACFLERKLGNVLYFPHRSFQEFLVAEKMLLTVRGGAADIAELSSAATQETAEFLREMAEDDDVRMFDVLVKLYRGSVRAALLNGWTGSGDYLDLKTKRIPERSTMHPWHMVWLTTAAISKSTRLAPVEVAQRILTRIKEADRRDRLVAVVCIAALWQVASVDDEQQLVSMFWRTLEMMYEAAFHAFLASRPHSAQGQTYLLFARSEALEAKFLSGVRIVKNPQGAMSMNVYRAIAFACHELRDFVMVDEWRDEAVQYATTRNAALFKPSVVPPSSIGLSRFVRDESRTGCDVMETWWRSGQHSQA